LPSADDVDRLSGAELPGFVAGLAALIARAAARMQEEATRRPKWRDVAWAAEQSGMSAHYFYERAEPTHTEHDVFRSFVKKRGRRVRIEEAGFWRWIQSR